MLITGGAGFIGSNVACKLVAKGYEVSVLDNLSPQIHGDDPEKTSPLYIGVKDKVHFIKGSVTSREDWQRALQGVDAVIHLAAETGTGQSMYEIEKYVRVNIGGTAILLDCLPIPDIGSNALLWPNHVPYMAKGVIGAMIWGDMFIRTNDRMKRCATAISR